jgi:hypothetical protein
MIGWGIIFPDRTSFYNSAFFSENVKTPFFVNLTGTGTGINALTLYVIKNQFLEYSARAL